MWVFLDPSSDNLTNIEQSDTEVAVVLIAELAEVELVEVELVQRPAPSWPLLATTIIPSASVKRVVCLDKWTARRALARDLPE